MNRRNLFKMLGAAAASVACAPLVKLLPKDRLQLTVNRMPYMNIPAGVSDDDLTAAAIGRFHTTITAQEDLRKAWLRDLEVAYGQAFEQGRIKLVEPDGTVKLLRA